MCKESENSWKDKAIARSKKIKVLTKEIKRQKERAIDWREKAEILKHEISSKDLIIKDLTTEKGTDNSFDLGEKIGTYAYSGGFMWLCVSLYKCGLSSRQIVSVIILLGLFTKKNIKVPCHSTILIWVHKSGLGLLEGKKASLKAVSSGA